MSWTNLVDDIDTVARNVADLLDEVDDFSVEGLGVWDVDALARHTTRALATLGRYLDAPAADGPMLHGAPHYLVGYLTARDADPGGTDATVAERGRTEAQDIPAHRLGGHLRGLADTLIPRLAALEPEHPVPTPWGPIHLEDYCRTRLCELVVHGLDLATATGLTIDIPDSALAGTLTLVVETAVVRGNGRNLLRLLSGRTTDVAVLPILR